MGLSKSCAPSIVYIGALSPFSTAFVKHAIVKYLRVYIGYGLGCGVGALSGVGKVDAIFN
jgi:hypothetical protein